MLPVTLIVGAWARKGTAGWPVDNAVQEIEHGSSYRVLEVFKGRDAGLVEEVNQVRRHRNWVAHGRRTAKPAAVDPETAFRRLKEFLDVLGIGTEQSF